MKTSDVHAPFARSTLCRYYDRAPASRWKSIACEPKTLDPLRLSCCHCLALLRKYPQVRNAYLTSSRKPL